MTADSIDIFISANGTTLPLGRLAVSYQAFAEARACGENLRLAKLVRPNISQGTIARELRIKSRFQNRRESDSGHNDRRDGSAEQSAVLVLQPIPLSVRVLSVISGLGFAYGYLAVH
jgi:hypothetical protein